MIELKATSKGNHTTLEFKIRGTAEEIGLETAHIVTELPERLLEECYPAFLIMKDKFEEIAEEARQKCMDSLRVKAGQEDQDGKRN